MMLIYTEKGEKDAHIHNLDTGITYVLRFERVAGQSPASILTVSAFPLTTPTLMDGHGYYLCSGKQAEEFWSKLLNRVGFATDERLAGAVWFMDRLMGRPVAEKRPDDKEF